ncbi:hypothetical protein OSB04_026752 [Centaurea solstitialis]|uniref:HMA domain-containing protein n=1 Tax=Centaurea solstitialis TaxID=347529 RepID=A0AA38W9K5_9ASTR|nr:hypothetical protein OSB04_026752 [Centaurea solstitialis]
MSQTVVLKVGMSCGGCVGAVKRVLGNMEGVETFDIDLEQKKVTVIGNVEPDAVLQTVSKTGKKTEFWPTEAKSCCGCKKPAEPAAAPSCEAAKPVEPTAAPSCEATKTVEPAAAPACETGKTVEPAAAPACGAGKPVEQGGPPCSEAGKPVEPVAAETEKPVEAVVG